MTEILFIKTSSMGDVLHHMPAVTDARRRFPRARIGWMVEESFVPLARLHPAIDEVIPVAVRRWRRSLHRPSTWREISAFLRRLRARRYDAVIDTQGLFKTGLIAGLLRGRRHGYDAASIRRERWAAWFYDVRHPVERGLHAIERNRILTGLALGYTPEGGIDYGLDRGRLSAPGTTPYAILLHASARREKLWPEEHWIAAGTALAARGLDLVLPWGTDSERARSERLATAIPRARVPGRQPLDEVARLLAGATLVIGVDTGLLHLAAALGVPLVAIFTASEPGLTGPRGNAPMTVLGGRGTPPAAEDVLKAAEALLG